MTRRDIILAASQIPADDVQKRYEAGVMREFEARFNHLVAVMIPFAEKYNAGLRAVWPLKEGEALQKAADNLRKSGAFYK